MRVSISRVSLAETNVSFFSKMIPPFSGDVKLDKYWAIRNVTEKYFPGNKLPVPEDSKKLGGIPLKLTLAGILTDQIGPGGFILYIYLLRLFSRIRLSKVKVK